MIGLPEVIQDVAMDNEMDYVCGCDFSEDEFSFDGFNETEAVFIYGDSQGNLEGHCFKPLGDRKFSFQKGDDFKSLSVKEAREKGYTLPEIAKVLYGPGGISKEEYIEREVD